MPQTSKRPELDPKDLEKKIGESLKQYDGRSTLEIVALFLGKAQILEQGLKGVLIKTYGLEEAAVDRLTLGQAIGQLEQKKIRGDYLALLRQVNEARIAAAHEILAQVALLRDLVGGRGDSLALKPLVPHGIYSLEHAILVFDFLQEHDAWSGADT